MSHISQHPEVLALEALLIKNLASDCARDFFSELSRAKNLREFEGYLFRFIRKWSNDRYLTNKFCDINIEIGQLESYLLNEMNQRRS